MDAPIIVIAMRDRMVQMEQEIRKMEQRINKLEAEIIDLKRQKPQQTTLETLILKGAKYEQEC